MDPIAVSEIVKTLSLLGAAIAIGLGGIGAGIGVGMAGGLAVEGMGRQRQMKSELFRTMLIGQAAASTPPTFALVVSILLLFTKVEGATLVQGFAALGAGISIGAAAFASGVGSSFPVALACSAIARQPRMRRPYMTLMLLGQAVSQTPVI
ncbi:ATP synthase F0 subunit C, partial [bacterium]